VVLEEEAGGGIAGDVDFRPSVVVEIGGDGGEPKRSGGFGDPRRNADIGEGAAGSPSIALVEQARLPGDVGKRAVAVVAVEDVLRPAGNENILEAVVV